MNEAQRTTPWPAAQELPPPPAPSGQPTWAQTLSIANGGTGKTTALAARQALYVGLNTDGSCKTLTTAATTVKKYGHYVIEVVLVVGTSEISRTFIPYVHRGGSNTVYLCAALPVKNASGVDGATLKLTCTDTTIKLDSVNVPSVENAPSYSTTVYLW